MPELPEVENFRRLLLPLVSETDPVNLERLNLDKKPPRKFLSDEDIKQINDQKYVLKSVLRRGKLICMELHAKAAKAKSSPKKYLYVHMGMTGRISTPDYVPNLQELKKDADYPPPHTYLKFATLQHNACFSDPRKFGSVLLASDREEFEQLAPDAWTEVTDENRPQIVEKLSGQSMGIKALLLDQKRVVSGVGNWVADEVLYQSEIHPDQNKLTVETATTLLANLQHILQVAVDSLESRKDFPEQWLFHYRWNSKQNTKDAQGRTVTFITSGGRTSAVVPSLQKKTSGLGAQKKNAKSEERKPKKSKQATTTKKKKTGAMSAQVNEEDVKPSVAKAPSNAKVEMVSDQSDLAEGRKTASKRKRKPLDPVPKSSRTTRRSPRFSTPS